MDKDILVAVNNVSKKFCKNLKRSMAYGIADLSKNLVGIKPNFSKLKKDEFWSLKDISFELKSGEALGLIGVNGSGKTTLLRLLAGIFPPDKGTIFTRGRAGSLIAVGAGFHPHMTGRENIYLNGTILNMSRSEINKKFDEIVDFAEISDFLDAPVATYSSGMKIRLGFAIAISVNPDFLLIDEILSVGDLGFRTKCLKRLNDMKNRGVAFILVSHNITHIIQFTNRTICLNNGKIELDGPSLNVSNVYVNSLIETGKDDLFFGETLENHPDLVSASVRFTCDDLNTEITEITTGDVPTLCFNFVVKHRLQLPNISFPIYHESGQHLTTIASIGQGVTLNEHKGAYVGTVKFGPVNFNPGSYAIIANLHDGPEHLFRSVVVRFKVKSSANKMTWGLVDFEQDWQKYSLCK